MGSFEVDITTHMDSDTYTTKLYCQVLANETRKNSYPNNKQWVNSFGNNAIFPTY